MVRSLRAAAATRGISFAAALHLRHFWRWCWGPSNSVGPHKPTAGACRAEGGCGGGSRASHLCGGVRLPFRVATSARSAQMQRRWPIFDYPPHPRSVRGSLLCCARHCAPISSGRVAPTSLSSSLAHTPPIIILSALPPPRSLAPSWTWSSTTLRVRGAARPRPRAPRTACFNDDSPTPLAAAPPPPSRRALHLERADHQGERGALQQEERCHPYGVPAAQAGEKGAEMARWRAPAPQQTTARARARALLPHSPPPSYVSPLLPRRSATPRRGAASWWRRRRAGSPTAPPRR